MSETETYLVLRDPVTGHYYSENSVPRVYARAAKPIMSREAAEHIQNGWWRNKRFSEIKKVTLTIEDDDGSDKFE